MGSLFVEQFVDEGLGNSAYLVGCRRAKVAALIDPLRDVDRYLAAAERLGVTITHVLETHLHADFISGAREAAARTAAEIGASADARLGFPHRPLRQGDKVVLGDAMLSVLSAPGHSPEHIAFLAGEDGGEAPKAVFTGGSLIVGGAARTDLMGHELTRPLARLLYHTLHEKLLSLPDATEVYPTHGAGSYCAATGGDKKRASTIGEERRSNRLAQVKDEEAFVEAALSSLPSYPLYYAHMRPINQRGPAVLGGLPSLPVMAPRQVREWTERGGAVLDVRSVERFAERHVPRSYGIAEDAPLIVWAGWLIPFRAPLVLVADDDAQRERAVRQLLRIGYDEVCGYLESGIEAWEDAGLPIDRVPTMSSGELWERMGGRDRPLALDVRSAREWAEGHVPGALHIEAGRLPWDALPLPRERTVAVYCAEGPRSMAAISVLARRGYRDLALVKGGFNAWKQTGLEVETGDGDGHSH